MTPNGGKKDPQDQILESCLEEILGGHTPPDLKAEILARHAADSEQPAAPPVHVSAPPVSSAAQRLGNRNQTETGTPARRRWVIASLVTSTAVAALIMISFQLSWQDEGNPPALAQGQNNAPSSSNEVDSTPALPQQPAAPKANNPSTDTDSAVADSTNPQEVAPTNTPPETEATETDSQLATAPVRLASPQVIDVINDQIDRTLQISKIEPVGMISDETWCRRMFQSMLGRTASDDELRQFTRLQGNRREAMLDQMFKDERYQKEYAAYWSNLWTEQLLSQVSDSKHADAFRAGLQRYLQSAFQQNKPYDEWTAELIAAEGSNSVQSDDFNGASNYLLALRDENGVLATSEVCRVLMGQRIQCAQCHQDVQNDREQEEFWGLTAFFRDLETVPIRPGRAKLVDQPFAENADGNEVRFQRGNDGEWAEVAPVFIDGSKVNMAEDRTNRRQQFADMMVATDEFAEAAVNRFWQHFLTFGFNSPIDDMGRHNPASHPELLSALAEQFRLHDFDTTALIKWIVMSEPFNRSDTITVANGRDAPLLGSNPHFSRFYHRPVFFTNASESLAGLTNGEAKIAMQQVPGIEVMLNAQIQQLPGTNERGKKNNKKTKVEPIQIESFGEQLSSGYRRLAASLAKSSLSPEQRIDHVFLAVLGRIPTDSEQNQGLKIYQASKKRDKTPAIEQLIWALTRTSEYSNQ